VFVPGLGSLLGVGVDGGIGLRGRGARMGVDFPRVDLVSMC
jgi:hypothetical protein